MRKRKAPAATPGARSVRGTTSAHPGGRRVSACKNSNEPPSALAAPAFIWRARPGFEARTVTPASFATLHGGIGAAAVNDDNLVTRTSPNRAQGGGDIVFFVQRRDDDGDPVQASVFGCRNSAPGGQVFRPINVLQRVHQSGLAAPALEHGQRIGQYPVRAPRDAAEQFRHRTAQADEVITPVPSRPQHHRGFRQTGERRRDDVRAEAGTIAADDNRSG